MYTLTLTASERETILFVASRGYAEAVAAVIRDCDSDADGTDNDETRDLTFRIPEHMAWEIATEEQENGGHAFGPVSDELTAKLYALVNQIV